MAESTRRNDGFYLPATGQRPRNPFDGDSPVQTIAVFASILDHVDFIAGIVEDERPEFYEDDFASAIDRLGSLLVQADPIVSDSVNRLALSSRVRPLGNAGDFRSTAAATLWFGSAVWSRAWVAAGGGSSDWGIVAGDQFRDRLRRLEAVARPFVRRFLRRFDRPALRHELIDERVRLRIIPEPVREVTLWCREYAVRETELAFADAVNGSIDDEQWPELDEELREWARATNRDGERRPAAPESASSPEHSFDESRRMLRWFGNDYYFSGEPTGVEQARIVGLLYDAFLEDRESYVSTGQLVRSPVKMSDVLGKHEVWADGVIERPRKPRGRYRLVPPGGRDGGT